MDNYNIIKNYIYSHNWDLEESEFYNLIENVPDKVGYYLQKNEDGSYMETSTHYVVHFWYMQSDLYGDIWIRKYNRQRR